LWKKLVPSRPFDDILIPSIPWWSEFEGYVQELYVVVVCVLESTTADPSWQAIGIFTLLNLSLLYYKRWFDHLTNLCISTQSS
jgi:hypothetical protein